MSSREEGGPLRGGFSEPASEVFADLADRMRVPIWVFNTDLIVVYANSHSEFFLNRNDLGVHLDKFPVEIGEKLRPLIKDSLDSGEALGFEGWIDTGTRGKCYWKITCVALSGRLVGVVVNDWTGRKNAEAELVASESRYRAFTESLPDMIFLIDRDGRFIDYHAGAVDKLAVSPDEIVGQTVSELLPQGLAQLTLGKVAETLDTGQMQTYEYELAVPQGLRQFESRMSASGENEVLAVIRDITVGKKAEKNLCESEELFRVLMDSMQVGIAILDSEFNFEYVNKYLCSMIGYSYRELIGHSALDMVDQPSEYKWVEGAARNGDGETPHFVELTLLGKDGHRIITLASPAPIYDENGESRRSFAIFTDITLSKLVEEDLRSSEEEFRMVVSSSQDAIITIDQDGSIHHFNKAAQRMFGYRPSEMIGQTLDELLPAALRSKHHEFVANFFAAGKPDGAIGRTLELPAVRRDGTEFPIELSLSVGTSNSGQYVIANVRDISQRRKMEQALHESEVCYRYVFENVGEGIMFFEFRPAGDIVCTMANPAAERLLGAASGELNGVSFYQLLDEKEIPRIEQEVRMRATGQHGKYEAAVKRLDGRLHRVVITASPRFDDRGNFQGSFILLWDAASHQTSAG